ncbi:MAG: sulfite exporter TauE/SafE family protein [Acidimicrobiales bacterium]|nr:sulfite exporter TauE/SafE family protein [Acidimicrobiales bacterium]
MLVAAVVLGLLIGFALGSLGGGGSILAVPVLVYVAGQTVPEATATSLVAVAAAAVVGMAGHARGGRVRWGTAAVFAATGVGGSWLGTKANGAVDPDALLLGFSVLILVAAHRMLTACPTCTKVGEEEALEAAERDDESAPSPADGGATVATATRATVAERVRALDARSVVEVVAAGTLVGFLTGLFGVGGGFVIVPALTLVLGMSMPVAIGTSLAIIVANALVALGFRGMGAVDWDVALPFTITMLIGSAVGSAVADKLPPKKSLVAFAALLLAVAVANGVAAAAALIG